MKKAISILLICTLCSSMVSCAAAGKSSGEAAVEAGSEEAAAEAGSEEPAVAAGSVESAAENSSEEIDYTTGTPWMCIDLEGNVTADTPTDLKDDYGLWANKDRILSLKIQEGLPAAGNNVDLALQANENKEAMFHGQVPQGHDARLAYDYYYLLTDWDSRDAAGVAPLKEMVDAVEGIKSLDDLTAYLVNTPGEDHLYDLWEQKVRQDPENPGKCLLSIETSFFFLKDPAEYREMTAEGEYRKEAFAAYFRNMLVRLGYSEEEAKQKFDHCFAWESMMNAAGPGEEESSPEFTEDVEHLYTRDDLMAAAPNVPLLETLEKADGYPAMEKYYIPELTYIEKLNELYTEENVPLMRDYIILQGIFDMAGVLDWESYVMYDECLAAISYDISELDRETYPENQAYSEVDEHLAWPVAQLYVENYTNPGDKERISKLVDEIIRAYYGIIDEAEFLSDETRAGAYEKLDHMSINVLYPDNWAPYSFEDVDFASKEEGGTLWEAFRAVIKHEHKRDVEKLSEPYDRKFWDSLPFAVNCAYVPDVNGIYICAGFAQGDNYYPGIPEEELYARLGAAIAHEISHAFDAEGSKYDEDGNRNNWWTEEDRAAFLKKNEKLAAYFNAMHPWEGQDFDGENWKEEACADMGALKCLFRIAARKEDFDYDAFFRSYADRYACQNKPELMDTLLADVHPLNYLRVNANLQQFDEFLNFYGITEGDNMYLAHEDRVAIW